MKVIIQREAFDPYAALTAYQKEHIPAGKYGAAVSFVGAMRDFNEGQTVSTMTLDHYPGMTEREIEKVCQEALDQWQIDDVLVVHRCGEIHPDDAIVLVAVWSAHRSAGFDACRYVINYLKKRAPFWKHEQTGAGSRWVEGNTEDPAADR